MLRMILIAFCLLVTACTASGDIISDNLDTQKDLSPTEVEDDLFLSTFEGILGHAHVQKGGKEGVACKYDPGSAFNWPRLRRALEREIANTTSSA